MPGEPRYADAWPFRGRLWLMPLVLCLVGGGSLAQDEQQDTGTAPATETATEAEGGATSANPPGTFVPSDQISPDSVIAFPADI